MTEYKATNSVISFKINNAPVEVRCTQHSLTDQKSDKSIISLKLYNIPEVLFNYWNLKKYNNSLQNPTGAKKWVYFADFKHEMTLEEKTFIFNELIKKYNAKSAQKLPLIDTINVHYDISATVNKELMQSIIKQGFNPTDYLDEAQNDLIKRYMMVQGLGIDLMTKAFKTLDKDVLIFGESADTDYDNLITAKNFYQSPNDRAKNLLDYYTDYLKFSKIQGSGVLKSMFMYFENKVTDEIENIINWSPKPKNIIYVVGKDILKTLTRLQYAQNKKNYINIWNYIHTSDGSGVMWAIGIENEFAVTIGNVTNETLLSTKLKSDAYAPNDAYIDAYEITDLKSYRVIEIININDIFSTFTSEGWCTVSNYDIDLPEYRSITKEFIEMVESNFDLLDIPIFNGTDSDKIPHYINELSSSRYGHFVRGGEDTAHGLYMVEVVTRNHNNATIDRLIRELQMKKNLIILVVKIMIYIGLYQEDADESCQDIKNLCTEYIADINSIRPYDKATQYDFIKMKRGVQVLGVNRPITTPIYRKDYLGSVHLNFTLPYPVSAIQENLAANDNNSKEAIEFKNRHRKLANIVQLLLPVFVGKLGIPDYTSLPVCLKRFCPKKSEGSFRIFHSKTIGPNAVDVTSNNISTVRQTKLWEDIINIAESTTKWKLAKSVVSMIIKNKITDATIDSLKEAVKQHTMIDQKVQNIMIDVKNKYYDYKLYFGNYRNTDGDEEINNYVGEVNVAITTLIQYVTAIPNNKGDYDIEAAKIKDLLNNVEFTVNMLNPVSRNRSGEKYRNSKLLKHTARTSYNKTLLNSFIYSYIPDQIDDYGVGHDFRSGHPNLGFEYRMLDFCTVDEIKDTLIILFFLGALVEEDERLSIGKLTNVCTAYNNDVVNNQLQSVLENGQNSMTTKSYTDILSNCVFNKKALSYKSPVKIPLVFEAIRAEAMKPHNLEVIGKIIR